MANYKLVNADQLDTDLKSLADKIREKAEMSDQLTFPSGFIDGIDQCSSLNFTVVGGTSQPSNPKENTIWVNTSTTISSWVISAQQPSNPTSGMVWISVGDSSNVAFNALKKNAIQVYPMSAKQYVNGSWETMTMDIYQGGKWNNSFGGKLYENGDEFTGVTGGWVSQYCDDNGYNKGSYTNRNGVMTIDAEDGSDINIALSTSNKIDISNYSKLTINVTSRIGDDNDGEWQGAYMFLSTESNYLSRHDSLNSVSAIVGISKTGNFSIDLSRLSGSYHVYVFVCDAKFSFMGVYLE